MQKNQPNTNVCVYTYGTLFFVVTAGQVTERGEQYAPDVSKTATLDLKGKRKGSKALLDVSTADETLPKSSEMYQPYSGSQV